jgi:hypothetical protein
MTMAKLLEECDGEILKLKKEGEGFRVWAIS